MPAFNPDDLRPVLDGLERIRSALGEQLDTLRRAVEGSPTKAEAPAEEERRPPERQKTGTLTLYDGTEESFADWKLVGSGELAHGDGELRISAGADRGLAYFAPLRFGDFRLRLQYRPEGPDCDACAAVRFLDPEQPVPDRDDPNILYPYDNQAYVAAHTGFTVLLGPLRPGSEPGTFEGVLLGDARGAQRHAERPEVKVDDWNDLEIEVEGDRYAVRLNGKESALFVNTDAYRGKPSSADSRAGFVGLLLRKGRIAIRRLELEARTPADDARPRPPEEAAEAGPPEPRPEANA